MKEGTKVKVVASITGHEFRIGEVVERKYLEEDNESSGSVGFSSELSGDWYMDQDEYEIIDKSYVVDILTEMIKPSIQCGMSTEFTKNLIDLIDKAKSEGLRKVKADA